MKNHDVLRTGSIDEQWDVPGLERALDGDFGIELPIQNWLDTEQSLNLEGLTDRIQEHTNEYFKGKEEQTGSEVMRNFEKQVMLLVLDQQWKDHLANMDYLRQGIGLRGYGQKQPKQEYKREAFEQFQGLLERIQFEVTKILARVKVQAAEDVEAVDEQRRQQAPMEYQHAEAASPTATPPGGAPPQNTGGPGGAAAGAAAVQPFVRDGQKVGRNDPCPCGSGKKFKQCHGKLS